MDSLGLLCEKPGGFCVEGGSLALTFIPNPLFLWKITLSTFAPESFRSVLSVFRVSRRWLHLSPAFCIHDLKDVFMYWPAFACFQARFLLRRKNQK